LWNVPAPPSWPPLARTAGPTSHILEGTAEITENPEEMLRAATRIGGRYMGEDRAEEFGRRNGQSGEILVKLRPSRVIAREGISD
jgi:hypothetical protein